MVVHRGVAGEKGAVPKIRSPMNHLVFPLVHKTIVPEIVLCGCRIHVKHIMVFWQYIQITVGCCVGLEESGNPLPQMANLVGRSSLDFQSEIHHIAAQIE